MRWATIAAATLTTIAAAVLIAAVSIPAPWPSRLTTLVVAVAVAAGARETVRDDGLGWTVAVTASAITLTAIVFPAVLDIGTTTRPGLLSVVLIATSLLALAAAAGRAVRPHGPRAHDHG